MKTNVLTPIIVLVCIYLFVALILKKPDTSPKASLSGISALIKERDLLKEKNAVLDLKYSLLQLKADSLNNQLNSVNQTIYKLKNNQHENFILIDHFNGLELYRFFASFNPSDSVANH